MTGTRNPGPNGRADAGDAGLGGFEQRLLGNLMIMIAEAPAAPDGTPVLRVPVPSERTWRHSRLGVAVTAGLAAAAVAVVAIVAVAVSAGLQHQAQRVRPGAGIPEVTRFPAADQAFYQVVRTGFSGPGVRGFRSECVVIWYATPLTGEGPFPAAARGCPANPARSNPGSYGDLPGHAFPALTTLSDNPETLLAQLSRAARRGYQYWNTDSISTGLQFARTRTGNGSAAQIGLTTHAAVLFTLVERLLEMPVPAALRDALYQDAGRIPGVLVQQHAVDIAGQPGTAFLLQAVSAVRFVLAPGSHRFLGLSYAEGPDGGYVNGMVVISSGLASKTG